MSLEQLVAQNIENKDTVEVSSRVCRRCCHQLSRNQLCAICHHPFSSDSYDEEIVIPQTVIPYQIDYENAKNIFKKWKRKKWFTPSNFKYLARYEAGTLMTFICPTIYFTCHTDIEYTGQRGRTVTRRVNGQTQTSTKWTYTSGRFQRAFNAMVVCNDYIDPFFCDAIGDFKWDLNITEKVTWDKQQKNESIVTPQKNIAELCDRLDKKLQSPIRRAIESDIGGSKQRIWTQSVTYQSVDSWDFLLPVYILEYRYRTKHFRVIINGQNGEIKGKHPISWLKVGLAVLLVLGLINIIFVLTSSS